MLRKNNVLQSLMNVVALFKYLLLAGQVDDEKRKCRKMQPINAHNKIHYTMLIQTLQCHNKGYKFNPLMAFAYRAVVFWSNNLANYLKPCDEFIAQIW